MPSLNVVKYYNVITRTEFQVVYKEKITSSAICYCFIIPEPSYQTPSSEASTSLHSCMEGILAQELEINPM